MSTSGVVGHGGHGFAPQLRHTNGDKNGTGSSLADVHNKRVVPGTYKKAGKYLLRIFKINCYVAVKALSRRNKVHI